MSNLRKLFLLLILVLIVTQTAHAEASKDLSAQKDDLVNEIYAKSGLERKAKSIPEIMLEGFDLMVAQEPLLEAVPKPMLDKVREGYQTAFSADQIEKTLKANLARGLFLRDARQVLNWLESPLGKKCTQLEEAGSSPEVYPELQKYTEQLQLSPPSNKRLELIERLDRATKSSEITAEMAMSSNLALAVSMAMTVSAEMRKPILDIASELEGDRPLIAVMSRERSLIIGLYLFRDMEDADIEKYLRFAEYESGRKYATAVSDGWKKAYIAANTKLAEILDREIGQLGNRTPEKKGI